EPLHHLRVRLNPQRPHPRDRPFPDVVLLLASPLVRLEPDDVMADLVKEQRQADRRLGAGRLDPTDDPPVGISHLPRAPAHLPPPAADANVVLGFDPPDDRLEVTHRWAVIG